MRPTTLRLALALLLLAATGAPAAPAADYEIGGPLAGVRLPPFPAQHGAPAGYPGCIPELAEQARAEDPASNAFTPEGMPPQLELYPGSVEHYRAYWFKYCPVRSFFDRQSQVRNFRAADLAGVEDRVEFYAEPIYWVPRHAEVTNTGRFREPVQVVRCGVKAPVLRLDLGELDIGLYAVRVIGAVETEKLRAFREPLFVTMRVNDGLDGETSVYRLRVGYCDEFYSVCEIYFHAVEKRRFSAELFVDEGSAVDLLVHNVSLDDALAGTEVRAVKSRPTLSGPSGRDPAAAGKYDAETRLARDVAIWRARTPINAQPIGSALTSVYYVWPHTGIADDVTFGAAGMTREEIEEKHGKWEKPALAPVRHPYGMVLTEDRSLWNVFLVNRKLDLTYTFDDLYAGRPLPDPYPFKDDGAGLFFPDPDDPGKGRVWSPIAWNVHTTLYNGYGREASILGLAEAGSKLWREQGDVDRARDGAIALIRLAYEYPTHDPANAILDLVRDPGPYRRDCRCRRRDTTYDIMGQTSVDAVLDAYDRLFDYIDGNQALADSVRRFVPWVRNAADIVALLDAYLVQTAAKRYMRYQLYRGGATAVLAPVNVLADTAFTRPCMDWLFSRTFTYPYPPSGLPDYLISGHGRDGLSLIGSYSYTVAALKQAAAMQQYIELGGDPAYDLRDPRQYPKPTASLYAYLDLAIAGLEFPRYGDVGGPDKTYGRPLIKLDYTLDAGWEWTGDPRFAYVIKNYKRRGERSDGEWAAIEAAAAQQARAPWMENRSRVLSSHAGILESGVRHDDYRFRRAAYLRVGEGWGHSHYDTLDLQVVAHGLPMTVDGGQRGGYSSPGDRRSKMHNVVEVDGHDWFCHSWVRSLSDMDGARYLCARSAPLHGARLFERQLALVDVDEGRGSVRPLPPELVGPDPAGLPTNIVTANSYVFDVFRVAGGTQHTYCFHATVNDPESGQPAMNARGVRPVAADSEDPLVRRAQAYIGSFHNEKLCGTAPSHFRADFRMDKQSVHDERKGKGTEAVFYKSVYDPNAPDKVTRLHLFNAEDALVMKGDQHCHQWHYFIPHLFVQRTGEDLESAFAAVIEPFAGDPFIESIEPLAIAGNEADARRAVALRVATKNARSDICFADGRPDSVRALEGAGFPVQVAAEYAYVSVDLDGVRQMSLSGGTLLRTPDAVLRLDARERRAAVVEADYRRKQIVIDAPWPAWNTERIVEIGTLPEQGDGYVTQYRAVACASGAEDGRSVITFLRGADYYRSRIAEIDEENGVVTCVLGLILEQGSMEGLMRNWVASNDAATKFWRADVLPWDRSTFRYPYRLRGAPVRTEDFPENAMRLWEYGVGDTVRQSTYASLRRIAKGDFELEANAPCIVSLRAAGVALSSDGQVFSPVQAETEDGLLVLRVDETELGLQGRAWLRVTSGTRQQGDERHDAEER